MLKCIVENHRGAQIYGFSYTKPLQDETDG